jgi:hypothetical protein
MASNRVLITVLLLVCLALPASSQGYMGTVSTGTGIVPPLTVGFGSAAAANVGSSSSLVNLTGSWSVDLKASAATHVDLQTFQKGGLLGGSGEMNQGGAIQRVTAAGFVQGDRPIVFIMLPDGNSVLRLELAASGASLAGGFDSISRDGSSETGTVTGSMVLAAGTRQIKALGTGVNPSATSGAWVGKAVKSLDPQGSPGSSGRFVESRSFYQESTGQGTTTTSEGTTTTSSTG